MHVFGHVEGVHPQYQEVKCGSDVILLCIGGVGIRIWHFNEGTLPINAQVVVNDTYDYLVLNNVQFLNNGYYFCSGQSRQGVWHYTGQVRVQSKFHVICANLYLTIPITYTQVQSSTLTLIEQLML